MPKSAKAVAEIIKTVAERKRKKVKLWHDYLTADGFLPGETPMSKEEEPFYLQKIAPYLPELAQTNPTRAAQLMQRIDALMKSEGQVGTS